jgi:hypothetical protein
MLNPILISRWGAFPHSKAHPAALQSTTQVRCLVLSGNSISWKRHERDGTPREALVLLYAPNLKPTQQGFVLGELLSEEMPSELDNGLFASSINGFKLFLAEFDRRTNHVLIQMLHPGSSRNRQHRT